MLKSRSQNSSKFAAPSIEASKFGTQGSSRNRRFSIGE